MSTLHDRLAELAEDAPIGGAPASELWRRGKRAHRIRAARLTATVLVIGAFGAGVGMRVADGGDDRPDLAPVGNLRVALPIEYPVGATLPELGDAPGALAAIWVDDVGAGAPEVVGLVADTGVFGTLPIDVGGDQYGASDPGLVLSPDGRMVAYSTPADKETAGTASSPIGSVIVRDLVSGEEYSPLSAKSGIRGVAELWVDTTHLVGHALLPAGGWTDSRGWVWAPGREPKLIDLRAYPGQPYLGYGWPYGGKSLNIFPENARPCSTPQVTETVDNSPGQPFKVPVLCDVLGVVGSETLLGHWRSDDPNDGGGTVVALDICGADLPYVDPSLRLPGADHAFEDPARRHAVVKAGAPQRVAFATGLIGDALDSLDAGCGAS